MAEVSRLYRRFHQVISSNTQKPQAVIEVMTA